jgi:hypothetical protein
MPKFYLGICFFLIAFVVGGWWVLGFFEIEMDNNRQIVLFFWSASNLLLLTYSGWLWCFSFTESLILAQDERWRRA